MSPAQSDLKLFIVLVENNEYLLFNILSAGQRKNYSDKVFFLNNSIQKSGLRRIQGNKKWAILQKFKGQIYFYVTG